MSVVASNPEEKAHVFKHFRITDDPLEMARAIMDSAPYTHVCPMGGRDNQAWFECSSALELDFSEPYFKEYVRRTGDVGGGILPDIDLASFYPWHGLHHTHCLRELYTDNGHLCYVAVVQTRDWNKQTAAECADKMALDYIQESVGERPVELEFIEMNNGLMKRNPKYLQRHSARPALSAQWLFSALINNWLATKATPEQRELVEADRALCSANHNGVGNLRDIKSYGSRELRRTWEDKGMSFAEFQLLGSELEVAR